MSREEYVPYVMIDMKLMVTKQYERRDCIDPNKTNFDRNK